MATTSALQDPHVHLPAPFLYLLSRFLDNMSSYGLDLSPAQAPLNCFGPSLSSRILSRLRPRHARKTEYNNRLREGDALMTEARDVFHACQHALGHETRTTIQVNLEGLAPFLLLCANTSLTKLLRLRIERDGLHKFSDYRGSQQAEEGAVSRAEAYRTNATRAHAMVTVSRLSPVFSNASH